MYQDRVKAYYDYTLNFYRVFWHGDTRAVHYGIWDSQTRNLNDALLNTNRVLSDLVNIKSGYKVLDAGCGVGGSAFWLVKNIGARVSGITVSERQLQKAKELQKRFGLANETEFYLEDYTKTHFGDETFDVVWAIESVCHTINKQAFLKEAYRVLKPGGCIVIADGFIDRLPSGTKEIGMMKDFLQGMALDNLAPSNDFMNSVGYVGFKNIKNIDKTEEILPTAIRMLRMSRWSWPLSVVTTWLGITPKLLRDNNRAGIDQYHLFKNRILSYRIFVAEK